MSYTPTTWAMGDTVTSAKLNNMETGIATGANPFVVTLTPTALDYSGTMDKTPAEIDAAVQGGRRILLSIPSLNAAVECSQFILVDGLYSAHANIVYNPGNVDLLMHIGTNVSAQTYDVTAFILTPMS